MNAWTRRAGMGGVMLTDEEREQIAREVCCICGVRCSLGLKGLVEARARLLCRSRRNAWQQKWKRRQWIQEDAEEPVVVFICCRGPLRAFAMA